MGSVGGETDLLYWVVTWSDAQLGVLSHHSVAILEAVVKCVIGAYVRVHTQTQTAAPRDSRAPLELPRLLVFRLLSGLARQPIIAAGLASCWL